MSIWHDKLKESGQKIIIISGAQYGIDITSLAAARSLGIPTGGTAPHGYRTVYGNRPELVKLGVIEHTSSNYEPRTYSNVKDSDGTLILAKDFNSPVTICTKKAIKFYDKPSMDCDLNDLPFLFDVVKWIDDNNITVLNVAGNRGKNKSESSMIFIEVKPYLESIFRAYKKD